MSTELRNFLSLSYEELEELNLKAKGPAQEARGSRQAPGRAAEVSHRSKGHQGRHRALQRPRRPPAHARLRQEVPGQELRQPHLRRLLHPRLYRAARKRPSPRHRLERLLLGARRHLRRRQGARLRRSHRQERHRPTPATCAACSRASPTSLHEEAGLHPQRRQRDRRLPLRRHSTPSATTTRPAGSSTSTPAATTTRCPAIRCAPSSTPPPKCSARWASRTRRTTPKSRPRSSRSTTATAKSSPPPTRSSSTSSSAARSPPDWA